MYRLKLVFLAAASCSVPVFANESVEHGVVRIKKQRFDVYKRSSKRLLVPNMPTPIETRLERALCRGGKDRDEGDYWVIRKPSKKSVKDIEDWAKIKLTLIKCEGGHHNSMAIGAPETTNPLINLPINTRVGIQDTEKSGEEKDIGFKSCSIKLAAADKTWSSSTNSDSRNACIQWCADQEDSGAARLCRKPGAKGTISFRTSCSYGVHAVAHGSGQQKCN